MFVKGDKIITTQEIFGIHKGEIFEITDVENELISFKKEMENGVFTSAMSLNLLEKYFEKYEEPKIEVPTVSLELVEAIMENSHFIVQTVFDKCTIVSCKLPNGFVIVESSVCVSPENYDAEIGIESCMKRIKDKIFELEAYKLHEELYDYYCDDCDCCGECIDDCPCRDEDCEEDKEDEDDGYDCLANDFDCDDCPSKGECWL